MWNFVGHCFWPWNPDFFWPKVAFLFLNVPRNGELFLKNTNFFTASLGSFVPFTMFHCNSLALKSSLRHQTDSVCLFFLHLYDHLTAPYCFALVHYLWYFPWKNIVLIIVDPPGCLAGPRGVPEASYRCHRGRVRQSHPAPTICGVIPQIKLKISLTV